MQRNSRRNNLRISGIKESPGENTDNAVLGIAKALGVELSPNDIGRSHRVGKPKTFASVTKDDTPPRPRDILVQFASYQGWDKLFVNKAGLKDSTHNGVYLNEDLTCERSSILFKNPRMLQVPGLPTVTYIQDKRFKFNSCQHTQRSELSEAAHRRSTSTPRPRTKPW